MWLKLSNSFSRANMVPWRTLALSGSEGYCRGVSPNDLCRVLRECFPRKVQSESMVGTLGERFLCKVSPEGVAKHSSGALFVLNATEEIR